MNVYWFSRPTSDWGTDIGFIGYAGQLKLLVTSTCKHTSQALFPTFTVYVRYSRAGTTMPGKHRRDIKSS